MQAITGKRGEDLAVEFLQKQGYRILERNYRHKHSEIDIITQFEDTLVFVEVKTRTNMKYGHPEEFVDDKQTEKIMQGADHYLSDLDWKGDIRFDIIAIEMKAKPRIEHFVDAFY